MIIKGRVIKYGDNINTDVIYPGRYLEITDPKEMAKHAMEDLDKNFHEKLKNAKIIVAGKNFGCGSSREQAVTCLKYAGIEAIIAKSFARIFFRNAINEGIPALEFETDKIDERDEIEIDVENGKIRNLTKSETYDVKPLPKFLLSIIKEGGLIPYMKVRKNEI
ncbi:MAG: 3-isopropylmalate dehydratase small subunit [Thermoplasmatales archaeon]|nr:3-isopropylmalate dehydratase small subunit [Thermoplasmatales archaeon]